MPFLLLFRHLYCRVVILHPAGRAFVPPVLAIAIDELLERASVRHREIRRSGSRAHPGLGVERGVRTLARRGR
jgi:hypothetical protein